MAATLPYIGYIIEGSAVTIGVSLVAFLAAMILGAAIAVIRISNHSVMKAIAAGYISTFRALPELLCVFIVYYGLDYALSSVAQRFDVSAPQVSPFVAVTLAVGLQFGAYCAEIFADAVRAIPAGLVEAGEAIGLGAVQITRRITLPLMFLSALPALGNIFLVVLKVSALASVIGLEELTRRAKIVAGTTREPFAPYIVAVGCFLVITGAASLLQRYLESRNPVGPLRGAS